MMMQAASGAKLGLLYEAPVQSATASGPAMGHIGTRHLDRSSQMSLRRTWPLALVRLWPFKVRCCRMQCGTATGFVAFIRDRNVIYGVLGITFCNCAISVYWASALIAYASRRNPTYGEMGHSNASYFSAVARRVV